MKTFRKFDPDNDEVLFRYSMESCIGEMEQARYINEIHIDIYGAQNEAYMSRSAEKLVRGLCFNELGVSG